MAVIKVPKTPKKAYDTTRAPGDLLKRQIEHLEWAIRPASQRSPQQLKVYVPKTEGEAAAHIAKLTDQLHRVSAAAPEVLPAQDPAAVQARVAEKAKLRPDAAIAEGVQPAKTRPTRTARARNRSAIRKKPSAGSRRPRRAAKRRTR